MGVYLKILTVVFLFFFSCIPDDNKSKNKEELGVLKRDTKLSVKHAIIQFEGKKSNVLKESKIISSKYPLNKIFGTWGRDNTEKADFSLDSIAFNIIDEDDNRSVPYILNYDTIKIFEYHDDILPVGIIKKATDDSLIILWEDGGIDRYFKIRGKP